MKSLFDLGITFAAHRAKLLLDLSLYRTTVFKQIYVSIMSQFDCRRLAIHFAHI